MIAIISTHTCSRWIWPPGGNFRDMKDAEGEMTALPLNAEWRPRRSVLPQCFIHHKMVAIKPTQRLNSAFGEIAEHVLIECSNRFTVLGRSGGVVDQIMRVARIKIAP